MKCVRTDESGSPDARRFTHDQLAPQHGLNYNCPMPNPGGPIPIEIKIKNIEINDLLWSAIEGVKVAKFQPDALSFFACKFVRTGQVFWIDARIGGRHYVALSFDQSVDREVARCARYGRAHLELICQSVVVVVVVRTTKEDKKKKKERNK